MNIGPMLNAYPDSMGGTLDDIADFLQKEKQNGYAFGTIHLIAVVLRSILHFGSEMKALFSEELHVNFQK